ncbi:MAG: L-serine ammonia-lyase, iron-sulfur-dependent, subunit alpha [Tissierellia bacterium]|jgi:L-serine dehydratase|nr:L-serine ammonia-lyase, iron-sulfur-dependent, subunit alpha [Tissierellia bacterium]
MERQRPSIFNDIVGPFMIGPSSSHTCAPSRIGYMSRQLLDSSLKKAVIKFAREGAYTNMYRGQRSDLGFVNGLLGNKPEDPKLRNAFKIAKEKDISITFEISDFEAFVPNIAVLELTGVDGDTVTVHSDSTGSGTFKLLKINGFDTSIIGDCYELLIQCNVEESEQIENYLNENFKDNEGYIKSQLNDEYLFNVKIRQAVSNEKLNEIRLLNGVKWVKLLEPIISVMSNRNAILPFKSAIELEELSEKTGKTLWELGVEYECVRSGWTREEVIDYMEYVIKTMESGVKEALKGDIDMNGIIEPTAGKIDNYIKASDSRLDMGVLNTAVPWAMATMEYSSAMGLVLCAPTGGSAGIFPGAVLGVADYLNLSMKKKVELMFVTAVIGVVMSKDFTYSAELYGCQVEPGAASAMAAGALVYLMGGTAKQSLAAASCAVQNILGTICDPVAGLVQVPCISRNAMSVGNAVISANMVMGGYDPLIPLDESTETMFRVGTQLPSELRCTCNGGLCITQTGKRLALEQSIRDDNR